MKIVSMANLFRMKLSELVLFIAVLCLSQLNLGNFVHVFGLILIALYLFILKKVTFIDKKIVILFVSFLIVTLISLLYFILIDNNDISQLSKDSAINNFLFINIVSLLACLFTVIVRNESCRLQLAFVVKLVLSLHVIFFFVQYFVVHLSGYYIDFVRLFTSEESRYINYHTSLLLLKYRPTGMFVEPSTYSAAITALTISHAFLQNNKPSKSRLIILSMFSMLLSLSSAAIFEFILLYFAFYFNLKSRKGIYLILISIFSFAVFMFFADGFVDSTVNKIDATKHVREGLLYQIYVARNIEYILFGYGFYGIEQTLFDLGSNDFEYRIASFNDAGLINYIALKFGLLGLFLPVFIMFYFRKSKSKILCISSLLISKLSYIHPVFYLAIIPMFFINKNAYLGRQ
ncbi:hypothetical protein [Vibrio chagasii]|uniref:hypothetical protein n=1 Tax=Vibrio chagasii TaxID=170679 RepID=UPI003BB7F85F